MAVKGKGKQVATKTVATPSSTKRKKPVSQELLDRRKKRRPGVLQFFDDVADDADFEEEEEEDDEEEDDDDDMDYETEHVDLGFSKGGTSTGKNYKSCGKSHCLPFLVKEEELSGDELAEIIRDRYRRGSGHIEFNEDYKDCDDGVVAEHTEKDPIIWRVKCMVGREQQFAFCLMHKYADLQSHGMKMEIVSAFTLEHVKGYIYFEADKARDVVEACKGFLNIYPTRMGPVPKNEIPTLLSVRNKPCEISKGTWVRMKSGNYKGDLGQVVDYDDTRRKATVKLVPRIDLQAIAKKFGGGISLKGAAVPAPRLISSHEIEHFRPHIEIKRDRHSGEVFEVLDGLMLKDGYLYKKVSIASIVYWGVQPTKDELLKFTETSKAEEEDLSWLSSVFNVRKKTKPSKDMDMEGTSEQGSGFNLHDLVLFGRKGLGVIVDIGKDGIKILKGNTEVQEVLTVKSQDIKNNCVDKMFTASDRLRKTIYINDVVKVLDGPIEGRQGIVKHMYKGTLFIYDENQEENSGIFCIKSNLCENTTSPKDSLRKSGNKSAFSFNQSSFESGEQEDGSRSFSRNQRESNQIFSIGQTLRIRKGPLKGYLCHVVGIYRSDVTVKLDSLVKVITVQEQFLSVPNVKREISNDTPSDFFGAQEAGSSWQALTSSSFSFSTDQKPDQGGFDPWANKPATGSEQAADPWGSSTAGPSTEQGAAADSDPWASKSALSSSNQGGTGGFDPWASKSAPGTTEQAQGTDAWGNNAAGASTDQVGNDPWGSKLVSGTKEQAPGAFDPWGISTASVSTDKQLNGDDTWGGQASLGGSNNSEKPLDNWAKPSSLVGEQSSAWNKPSIESTPASDRKQQADPWGSKVPVTTTDRKEASDPWAKPSHATEDRGADPWGCKFATGTKDGEQGAADPWGSNMAGTSKDKEQNTDPWGSKTALGDSSRSKPLDSWAKASNRSGEQPLSWNNKATRGGSENDTDAWKNTSISTPVTKADQAQGSDPWGSKFDLAAKDHKQGADPWGDKPSVVAEANKGEADPWGSKLAAGSKDKVQGVDPWGSKLADESKDKEQGIATWGSNVPVGTSTDKAQKAEIWGSKASAGDFKNDGDAWNNKSAVELGITSSSSWDKPKVSSQSQSAWGAAGLDKAGSTNNESSPWNKSTSFGSDDKFNQKESWDKPSNFEGGRGFGGRGRGRGRFGERGGNRDDDNNQDNNSSGFGGGGWGSGRGRGDRFGGRGNRDDDNNDQDYNSSGFGNGGWGSGRGGRGGRGGRFQSSDRNNNNDQDNNNYVGGSSWGKSKGFEDNQSSNWNQSSNKDAAGGNDDKWNTNISKNDGDNWNTPKAFGSEWNDTPKKDWSASIPSCGSEASFGDWVPKSSVGNETAGGVSWEKSKGILGESPSKSWNQNSNSNTNEGGNWSCKPKTNVGENQSSGWGNNNQKDGSDWSKPKTSWNDNSSNFEDNGGSSYGGRGRGDSFSNRGRGSRGGRGRNFDGGGRGNYGSSDRSENFSGFGGGRGQSSTNWNDEGNNKSSWNSGGNNNTSSWTNQDTNNNGNRNGGESGGSSWNRGPKDLGNNNGGGSGWDTNKTSTAPKPDTWNTKKAFDGNNENNQSGGWSSGTSNNEKSTLGWGDAGTTAKKDDGGWVGNKGGW